MSAAVAEIVESQHTAAELCDQLFFEAGLTSRWHPASTPTIISEALKCANLVPEDSTSENDRVIHAHYVGLAARELARRATNQFKSGSTGSYRAHTATKANFGNCIAYHEVVAGYMQGMRLEGHTFGMWMGASLEGDITYSHATSGFIHRDVVAWIDGYNGKAELKNSKSHPKFFEAVSKVVNKNIAIVVLFNEAQRLTQVVSKMPLDSLHSIDIDEYDEINPDGQAAIIVPSEAAILMYAARGIVNDPEGRFADHIDKFQPYAPVL